MFFSLLMMLVNPFNCHCRRPVKLNFVVLSQQKHLSCFDPEPNRKDRRRSRRFPSFTSEQIPEETFVSAGAPSAHWQALV